MIACDAPGASEPLYSLTLHACRHCGGRLLRAGDAFRCSCCSAHTIGTPDGICGCGMLASWGSRPPRLHEPKTMTVVDTVTHWQGPRPFRCAANPAVSAKSPSEVVILFDGDGTRAA